MTAKRIERAPRAGSIAKAATSGTGCLGQPGLAAVESVGVRRFVGEQDRLAGSAGHSTGVWL